MKAMFVVSLLSTALFGLQVNTALAEPAITIYNDNFAVVKDDLSLDLKRGLNQVDYANMTSMVEADSVILSPKSKAWQVQLLEQQYLANPLQEMALLDQYEGETLEFLVSVDGEQKKIKGKVIRSGYLSSNGSTPIVEVDGKVQFGLPGKPLFPALSDQAILKPSLRWLLNSNKAGQFEASLSYLTANLSWQADYNIVANEQGEAELIGWISLKNNSGKDFEPSRIKLMAGDVNKTQPQQRQMKNRMVMAEMAFADAPAVKQESLDEFHLYHLPNKTALRDGETKQVQFLQSDELVLNSKFVYDGARNQHGPSGEYFAQHSGANYGQQSYPQVWLFREFKNDKRNGLGVPLPKGKVRFYRSSETGVEFIGDNRIGHTPNKELISLYSGNAFDVIGERVRTDYQYNKHTKQVRESFKITLKNRKNKPVEVTVVEHLQRWQEWDISGAVDFVKTSASSVQWLRKVAADSELELNYTVTYQGR